MNGEKKYVNGIVIKEKTFDNGGTQLKMSVKVDDFIAELKAVQDNGWANLIINKRKEMSDKGITHYVQVDPWKPDSKKAAGKMVEVAGNSLDNKDTMMNGDANDLPF